MADDDNKTDPNLPQTHNRKRKRSFGEALKTAYSSVTFSPKKLTSVCRPDSPGFFFSSSFSVIPSKLNSNNEEVSVGDSKNNADIEICQVVHQHVNGLCMVTAGELVIPSSMVLKSIRFVAKEAPQFSNAEKRKRQAKMLKGKDTENVVTPSTVIAELVLERTGEEIPDESNNKTFTIPLRACVWGTILELNDVALTPDVLLADPLLDGL